MKKILGAKNYTKLDDNVSFQLTRTNPILTSNVRLVYDGSNMFLKPTIQMENGGSSSNDHLSIDEEELDNGSIRVFCNDLFNNNLKDFWKRTSSKVPMFGVVDDKYNYNCGCISYGYGMSWKAPLYLKEKLPEYFVVFKVREDEVVGELPTTTLHDENIITTSRDVKFDSDDKFILHCLTDHNDRVDSCFEKYVGEVLKSHDLTLDMLLTGDGLYENEYYSDCVDLHSSIPNSFDLKQSKRFKNDIEICNSISSIIDRCKKYRHKFIDWLYLDHEHHNLSYVTSLIDSIIDEIVRCLVLKDKLYNKQLDPTSPLIQMCYYCYKNKLSIKERIDYYNKCFKSFKNWKFKKWGSKVEMIGEMEQLLAFYKNEDVPESYYFTINEDNDVIYVEHVCNILQKSTIVKTFDLSEHTTLGKYIQKYTSQRTFKFDKPIYVDYNTCNIYYYGIDKETGLLTTVVENFKKDLLNEEKPITFTDNYLTTRYSQKGLIFPYILNLEFLFNDKDSKGYKYYGLYCNGIDLYQHLYKEENELTETSYVPEKMELQSEFSTTLVEEDEDKTFDVNKHKRQVIEIQQISNKENVYFSDGGSVYYVKDKNNDLHRLPQYRHILQSHMFTESKGSYERANKLISRMLGDDYEFDKLTCHDIIEDKYETYFHYVDPTDVFNTYLDYERTFGYQLDSTIVDCERLDDAYHASLGFFIDDKPVNGSSICIKVLNKNLKLENGEYYVNREIHLTAKEEDIIHIHDKYFGKDVDKPFDDDVDLELYPDFGNTYKEFPIEDEKFVFGDEDGFTGETPVKNLLKEGFLTVEGECPFVGVGIVYEKDSTTLPITFYKYNVTMDIANNKLKCQSVKRLNRTSVFKDEVIEELLGFTPPKNYIRAIDDAIRNSNEIRIYPVNYSYRVEENENTGDSDGSEEGSTISDLMNARGEISVKVNPTYPFMGLGICKDSDGNIVKYLKYSVALNQSFNDIVNLTAIEEHYDVDGIGTEGMIDKIFGDEFKLAPWHIKSQAKDGSENQYDTDIIIALPKIVIKHTAFPEEDLTEEEKNALLKGAYDKADTTHFDYILRDENYKNLFITEPMKPGTFHITRNKTIYYSINGTTKDIATAICKALNSCPEWDREIEAYHKGNLVVFRHAIKGSKYNGDHIEIEVTFDTSYFHNKKFRTLCERYNKKNETYAECVYRFTGGTDCPKNTFLVWNDDIEKISNGLGEERYIKTDKEGVLTRVQAINPYVDNDGNVDRERSVMVTDDNGKYISSGRNRIEFVQRFYPTIGVLSFFPIKDFDTDLLYSIYGDNTKLNEEFDMTSGLKLNTLKNGYLSEYQKYNETSINFKKEYGKPSTFINKWCDVEYLDSCENPYRLDVDDVFGENNVSTNIRFDGRSDLDKLTHHVPYLFIPKWMYNKTKTLERIDYPFNTDNYISYGILNTDYYMWQYKSYIKDWNLKLTRLTESDFFDIFHNRYSVIRKKDKMGTYTIFKGMKFKFDDMYDGYKFSFVYIPVFTEKDNFVNKVYFIKNNTNKFICGVMYVNVYDTTLFDYMNHFDGSENFFNLSYIYNVGSGKVDIKQTNLSFSNKTDFNYVGIFELNDVKLSDIGLVETDGVIDWNKGVQVTSVFFRDMMNYIKNNTPEENPLVQIKVFNGEGGNIYDAEQYILKDVETLDNIIFENDMFRLKNGDKKIHTGVVNGYEHEVRISIKFEFYKCPKIDLKLFLDELRDVCDRKNIVRDVVDRFRIYTSYNIKKCIEDVEHVEYICEDGVDFKVEVECPQEVSTKTGKIYRYGGYYEPLTKNMVEIRDMFTLGGLFRHSNTVINI